MLRPYLRACVSLGVRGALEGKGRNYLSRSHNVDP